MDANEEKARGRRLKWIVGVLGAFVGILAAVGVAAPAVLNARGAGWFERWYAQTYHGRIGVETLALDWREPQSVDGVELFDPDGALVATGRMTMPPLFDWVRSRFQRFGRIDLELALEVARDAEGLTNLERAIEPREPVDDEPLVLGDLAVELHVHVTELAFTDAASALALQFEDVDVDLKIAPGDPVALRLSGVDSTGAAIELGADVFAAPNEAFRPVRAELSCAIQNLAPAAWLGSYAGLVGPEPLALDVRALFADSDRTVSIVTSQADLKLALDAQIHRAPFELPGLAATEDGSWDVELAADGTVPSALLDRALELDGLVAGALGPAIGTQLGLHWQGVELADAVAPVDVRVEAGPTSVALSGALERGRFRAIDDQGLVAVLDWTPFVADRIVAPLVPIAGAIDRNVTAGPIRLTLSELDCAVPARIDDLKANVGLRLGPATFAFLPGIAEELSLARPLQLSESRLLSMTLDGARVAYPEFQLDVGDVQLPLQGTFDLATRTLAFDGSLPAKLVAGDLKRKLGPAADLLGELALGFSIAGTPERPLVTVRRPEINVDSAEDLLRGGLKDLLETGLPKKR